MWVRTLNKKPAGSLATRILSAQYYRVHVSPARHFNRASGVRKVS
jgi:hypothetical protein